jgi:hypothetical protein
MNAMMSQLFIKLPYGGVFKSSSLTLKIQVLYPRTSLLTFLSPATVSRSLKAPHIGTEFTCGSGVVSTSTVGFNLSIFIV